MHTLDLVAVCTAVVLVLAFAGVLARQRTAHAQHVPLAVQRGHRWLYGIGRYAGGELRWYRALGVGTRPSRVLVRGQVEILGHRRREPAERGSLPQGAVVVECRGADGELFALAFGDSAYTGFVSWLESSAPMA